ncbi:type I restriction endonuclease subunit S [Luteimonas chenhongjianii]|uniref:Type I restriction endonuclease subunit S n=1 Tax=Luteimonas chenhongjianii TaxID=2006110 RepID=A0A290XFL6_9GAMM|nr:restriction endonuclease subunit S [Luteimonas chenhongjianii]ATD67917.1 type I restriction endonuclease subunit S [Luteimonas chenhongjianii]
MSLPRYPEYKDSGVEWLGYVPAHWDVRRLGHFFAERREKVSKDFPPLSVTKNGIVPQLDTAAKTDDGDNRKLVRADDFVINSRSDRKGSSGASKLDGSVSLINTVLKPTGGLAARFAHHLFRSVPFQEEYYRFGKGIVADLWSTNYSEMRNISLAVPEIAEQATITEFLDRETATIDALIAEQEKLLALLAEKRQATISHAVTRGLDLNVPMKDSGIAWLGEVPAHWSVAKLGLYGQVENGTTPSRAVPEYWEEGDIPWLASGEVNQVEITEASEFITTRGLNENSLRLLPVGTIVIGLIGQGRTRGMPAILRIPAAINQNLAAICVGPRLKGEYLFYVFRAVYQWLREAGRGGNQAAMNCEMLAALQIPVPPFTEQDRICSSVEDQSSKLDLIQTATVRAIDLLAERRSALISAAVTGQIDVRGLVSEAAA